ncbi:MAG: type II secretion system protein [Elusimicrobiaceae bacterium]|nr:type II secretion system protein [Elusimicrobiaceae bacterium]
MRGFTLIELLVVVLIIGVLASVALPQYQKAVAKARLAEFVIHARAVRDGLRMYSLANGSAATKVSDLDIWNSVQVSGGAECGLLGKQQFCDVGGHYIRTFVSLPGYSTWTCDFHWQGDLGFCYVYTEAGAKLAESLGWPQYPPGRSYHIMEDWRKK